MLNKNKILSLWEAVWICYFHNLYLKNGGTHSWEVRLDFISITQFSYFLVISYGNWKYILGVFSFHNYVFNGIFVIKTTYLVPQSEQNTWGVAFNALFNNSLH